MRLREETRSHELYIELAARIGDDGESMGLAIARCRGWSVLTDDKKARRIAKELGVPVLGTPEVIKQWAEIIKPSRRNSRRCSKPSSDSQTIGPAGVPSIMSGGKLPQDRQRDNRRRSS